jgi:hypothetical protein
MPPKAVTKVEPASPSLVDLPHQYLLEKSQWIDFKKALNTCGLTWNLPDWNSTILYKGNDYKMLESKGKNMDAIFIPPTLQLEENKIDINKEAQEMLTLLGISSNDGGQKNSMKFCNLKKMEYEPDSKLPARQKMWSWIVQALHGQKVIPGPIIIL